MTDKLPFHGVSKLVSGGQTGVDRGALDAAIELGIEHGGWCPRGRMAEDGPIPHHYQLVETGSADYSQRTQRNVIDSDGTLIIHRQPLAGGTLLTRKMAEQHRRPYFLFDLTEPAGVQEVRDWLSGHRIETLNCAGPRESGDPGIAAEAQRLIVSILG